MNEIDLLRRLVAIPSISGAEARAAAFLVDTMSNLSLESHIDEVGNAVGRRECPDTNGQVTNEIMLLGHIDTVPGNIPVRIEGDLLFGRGTVDAKGPLAVFVLAAARAQLAPGTRVIVVGAVEEEAAASKGARHIAGQYHPDYCIIGEPSGWDGVTLGYKGRLLIDYELHLPMAHSAGQELGAAETAVNWWNELNQTIMDFNRHHTRLFDQLIPSLRQIHTDSDGLTNSANLKVGIRLPPDFDIDAFTEHVSNIAGNAALRFYATEPAYQSTRRTPLAAAFNKVLRREGVRPRLKLKTGTSDMNVVGPIWNCPILAYGPGDSTLDHTPNEHIDLGQYLQAIQVLQLVLSAL